MDAKDGGFDDAISRLLSPKADYFAVTREVQAELYRRHRGFAPPGSASVVSFSSALAEAQDPEQEQEQGGKLQTGCKHIVVCPTMPWPTAVEWHKDLVYNTVWALLVELERFNAGAFKSFLHSGALFYFASLHQTPQQPTTPQSAPC